VLQEVHGKDSARFGYAVKRMATDLANRDFLHILCAASDPALNCFAGLFSQAHSYAEVRIGTSAKNVSVLLFGASNAGKTALTRPLIKMFDSVWAFTYNVVLISRTTSQQ
jgi:hypothetical protein